MAGNWLPSGGKRLCEFDNNTRAYTDQAINSLKNAVIDGEDTLSVPFDKQFNWQIGSISSSDAQDNDFSTTLRTPSGQYYNAESVNNAEISFLPNPNADKQLCLFIYFYDANGNSVTSDIYYNSEHITGQGIRQEIRSTFAYKKIRLNTEKVKKVRFVITDQRSELFTNLELSKLYIYNQTYRVKSAKSKVSDITLYAPYDSLDEKTKSLININARTIKRRITEDNLFAKRKYLKGEIGGKIQQDTNEYRSIYRIEIQEDTGYYIDCCRGIDANTPGQRYWVITNEDDDIVAVSDDILGSEIHTKIGCYIPPVSRAKNLYIVNQSGDFANLYLCDSNAFEIYKGDAINVCDKIGGSSGFALTQNQSDGARTISLNLTGTLTITIDKTKARTVGFWFKMNYFEIENIESIDIEVKNDETSINKRTLDVFHWRQIGYFFYKMVVNKEFNTVLITPNLKEGKSSVCLFMGENIYIDQFTFPYIGFNFDRAWASTDACGAYDNFIYNNVPFTITGSILDVSEQIQNKLMNAAHKGILDLGLYGNELYDGNSYKISDAISDYAEMQKNMEAVLTKKLSYCENPVSFGPRGHVITPLVKRCIMNNGFKVNRYAANVRSPANEVFNSKFDMDLITICEYGDGYSPYMYATLYGGGYIAFAHALSNNPESETEGYPANYQNWVDIIDKAVKLRRIGSLRILNLRQIEEMAK